MPPPHTRLLRAIRSAMYPVMSARIHTATTGVVRVATLDDTNNSSGCPIGADQVQGTAVSDTAGSKLGRI